MKILSVDTSSATASVAVLEDGNVLTEKFSEDQKSHSEKIVPLIDEALKSNNLTVKDIDEFCVCTGPGSFTGIRIGVALINSMAQALDKKVIGVSSLKGFIASIEDDNVCAIIDALHDNVYAQYRINDTYSEADCINIYELIEILKIKNKKIVFLGNGVLKYKNILEENLDCEILDKTLSKASDIAIFAYKNKEISKSPLEVVPVYLRKAQPER